MQETVRAKDKQLEELKRAKSVAKPVKSIAVQVQPKECSVQDLQVWKNKVAILEQQLRSVGWYNQELLEKYEPEPASDDDDEDNTGDAEDEEDEEIKIISSVAGRKKYSAFIIGGRRRAGSDGGDIRGGGYTNGD